MPALGTRLSHTPSLPTATWVWATPRSLLNADVTPAGDQGRNYSQLKDSWVGGLEAHGGLIPWNERPVGSGSPYWDREKIPLALIPPSSGFSRQ